MSLIIDDQKEELEIEEIQLQALRELRLIRIILQEMTNFEINKEDILDE